MHETQTLWNIENKLTICNYVFDNKDDFPYAHIYLGLQEEDEALDKAINEAVRKNMSMDVEEGRGSSGEEDGQPKKKRKKKDKDKKKARKDQKAAAKVGEEAGGAVPLRWMDLRKIDEMLLS